LRLTALELKDVRYFHLEVNKARQHYHKPMLMENKKIILKEYFQVFIARKGG